MVEVCDLCKKRIAVFKCNVCNINICNWCCDKFQIGQVTKGWKRYSGNYNNFLKKYSKECSKCDYCFRNDQYQMDNKSDVGFGSASYSFIYKDKLVFSWNFKELAKKKIRLVKEEENKNILDYYILGDSHILLGQYKIAYKNLIKAVGLMNGNIDNEDKILIYIKIYQCCEALNLYLEGEKWINKAIILDDTMTKLYRYKGDIYRLQNKYEKSIIYYDLSLDNLGYNSSGKMDSFYEFAYIGLAIDYSKLNKYDDTIKWANKFLNRIGDFEYIYEIYEKIKNGMTIDGLGFSFDMIVDLYNLITISYLEKKEFFMAKEYVEKSEKLSPDNIETAKLSGRVIQGLNMSNEINRLKKQLEEALSNRILVTANFNGEIKADMINIGDGNTNTFNYR
ncbi:hypothetical protein [Clostridium sp. JS66]|uniref:hypothetical protein n=1 Tax=Clostridium sp. JS66 TaxID=3064705 RepID=UPI00298D8C79|nr:hypothetical protein [Clostridium sp. JS66]WPC42844.1 hypothetical protein Q6H37_05065 [Clostridium sp. JS66]